MRLIVGVVCVLLSSQAVAKTLVHAGQVLDVVSGQVVGEQTIVIDGDRVEGVEAGYREPGEGDEVIDLREAFVTPGWIDMHVHISSEQSPTRYIERFTLNPADHALRGATYAKKTLHAGFTTVRDLGTSGGVAQALRKAVAEGIVEGPRIFTAGKSIATTGGHADPSNGVNIELSQDPGPIDGVINSPEEAYKAVRARYKEGSDLIKITATGGVLSPAKSGQNPQFRQAEVDAIVAAAKDYGFKVAAHAHGSEGMKRAVLAGVDSIEHGTYMTEEIMRLMKRRGTWYVPTILAGNFVAEKAKIAGYFPEIIRPKAAAIGPVIHDTFKKAYEAGVPIAFGTDCGVCPHGSNWQEFVFMVKGGMPAHEAIQAATTDAAELLGQSDALGSLEPGKLADIVALPGDPAEDPQRFGQVLFVMKAGRVYKHDGAEL